jgi:flagella basal body P-ring formation protein FlgA
MMTTAKHVAKVVRLQTLTEFSRIQLLTIVIVATWAATSGAATQITLRDKVEMTRHVVRLSDVAEIECDDHEQARELKSLPLMPAPAAGSQHFIRQQEVMDSLAAHGFDLTSLTVGGASQVIIVARPDGAPQRNESTGGAANKLAISDVRQPDSDGAAILSDGVATMISNYLTTKSADAASWTVTCDLPPRHAASLAAATSRPVCKGGAAPWTGRQRFEISFTTAKGTTKFAVYADVTPAAMPVVVTTRALARGEVVTAADVELQEVGYVPKPNERRVAARSIDMLVGMEVRQPIPAGSMVFTDAVKRGDVIRISSQSGGIRVRTTAKALQDRSHGQLVEVESLTTKERFDARVVGPGEAVVLASAPETAIGDKSNLETARR